MLRAEQRLMLNWERSELQYSDSQYTGLEVFEYLLLVSCVRYHRDPHRLGFAAV